MIEQESVYIDIIYRWQDFPIPLFDGIQFSGSVDVDELYDFRGDLDLIRQDRDIELRSVGELTPLNPSFAEIVQV